MTSHGVKIFDTLVESVALVLGEYRAKPPPSPLKTTSGLMGEN